MSWLPTPSPDVERLATPATIVPVPRLAPPSKNSTDPPGVADASADVTVAVNVTLCPKVDGFGLLARSVDEAASGMFTVATLEYADAPMALTALTR